MCLSAKWSRSAKMQLTCSQYHTCSFSERWSPSFLSLTADTCWMCLSFHLTTVWLLLSPHTPEKWSNLEGVRCWPKALPFSVSQPLRKLETKRRPSSNLRIREQRNSSIWLGLLTMHHVFIMQTLAAIYAANCETVRLLLGLKWSGSSVNTPILGPWNLVISIVHSCLAPVIQ